MLPLDKPWYTKLLLLSLLLGAFGGVAALLYTGITDRGIAAVFGDAQSGWFTGDWWWILVTAAGGLVVAGLRKAWTIPEKVPGAFLKAPLSLILIAVATIGIAPEALMPVAIAVITAHITLSLIQTYVVRERHIKLQAQ